MTVADFVRAHGLVAAIYTIAKSLTGDSINTSEDLSIALDKIKSKISEDEETLEKLKSEDEQKKLLADSVLPAYRQFKSWAEEFEDASLETKKMIAVSFSAALRSVKVIRSRSR